MCGIVGYVGRQEAAPILLDGLERLEYRGYDSAGIAVCGDGVLRLCKKKGRVAALRELTHDGGDLPGTLGIGHTRWATHGEPNDVNAHPHVSEDGRIALVHNGIIENYMEIKSDGEIARLNKFMAGILGCDVDVVYEEWEKLLNVMIPKKALHEYGVSEEELEEFTDSVLENQGRLMANNFVKLDRERVYKIYKESF